MATPVNLPVFTPNPLPSPGTTIDYKPRIRVAEFGEGYSQPVADGINHISPKLALNWEALTPSQADTITNFFIERGGVKSFWFRPTNGSLSKWRCEEWSDKIADDGVRQISAQLVRSNTLED